MLYAWIIGIIIVVLSLYQWFVSRNDDYWKKKGIPFMPRMSLFTLGYTLLKKDVAQVLMDMSKPYGRVVGSFEGSTPSVVVKDPNILRDVLVKDFHVFPYRRIMKTYDPIADAMVTMVTGEDWKRIRTIITPAFTSKRMRQMASIMNDCSKSLLEVCEKHARMKESLLSSKVHSKVRENFLTFTIPRLIVAMLVPGWILRWIPFDLNPMILDKDNFFKNVIKRRKESGRRYNDFLQMLMDIADETTQNENQEAVRFGSITNNGMMPFNSKNKKLSTTELLAQCVLFFSFGYETTTTALTFVAYCLATNPDWQEKLIKEVDEAFEKHVHGRI
ncbi:thromboxane-A synthase [Trichonephila clavata]|uniref:Thromboxane-A synthase n=1 Tax=Trichonephila clavata TaxID=2740835 RepID=A0A8X6HCJ1_TRICU|nr:thromboxane-A synthase [Trichonephila clavata]